MKNSLEKYINGGGSFDKKQFKVPPTVLNPTYSWLWSGTVTKAAIIEQLDEMKKAGIVSFYILPLPKDFSPGALATDLVPEYLSDEYFELVRFTAEYASKNGMSMWLYDEGGWPSGNACEKVVAKAPELAAKKMVKTENGYELAIRYYPYTLEPKPHYADSASEKANDIFIDLTYEPYKEKTGDLFGTFLPLMFTDEPAIRYPAWPDGAEQLYKQRYGEDMRDALPAIFSNDDDTENQCLRIQYCTVVAEIFRKNYFEKLHNWCLSNGIYFAGHINMDNTLQGAHMNHYGSQVDVLRELDIPGIDVIWRQIYPFSDGKTTTGEFDGVPDYPFFARLAPSAANQTGKNLSVSESFGIYGHGITADIMRYVANYQFVRGINLINVMAVPFERSGSVPFTTAPFFFGERPDFENLKQINDYMARMSYLTTLGRRDADTALIVPVEDVYAMGEREKRALESFKNTGVMLERAQVDFDIIDAKAIAEATVKDGVLCIGNARYKSVILPKYVYLADELKEKISAVSSAILPVIECYCKNVRAMRRVLDDGRRLYFIFNEKNSDITVSLNLQNVGRLDCTDGEIYELDPRNITLVSGEMLVLITDTAGKKEKRYTKEIALCDFKTRVVSELYLSKDGVKRNTACKSLEITPDFSGEVGYTAELELDIPCDACITFQNLFYSARVLVNGQYAGIVSLAPYRLKIPKSMLKSGKNTIEIIVANTPANAYARFDASEHFEKRFLGTYNQKQRMFEKDSLKTPSFDNAKLLF